MTARLAIAIAVTAALTVLGGAVGLAIGVGLGLAILIAKESTPAEQRDGAIARTRIEKATAVIALAFNLRNLRRLIRYQSRIFRRLLRPLQNRQLGAV